MVGSPSDRSVSSPEAASRVLSADEAFARDIPESVREDVLQRIFESLYGNPMDGVIILDHDRFDAINSRAQGTIKVGGREFWFYVEDGNRNGSVLLGWEDGGEPEYSAPCLSRSALAPPLQTMGKHLEAGQAAFLLAKWDAMLSQPDVAEIPTSYDYDRFFQPGAKVRSYWAQRAAMRGFELTDEATAKERRARLNAARSASEDTQRSEASRHQHTGEEG